MYPQFADGQPPRGMADIRARPPFPGYYPNKVPEGSPYGGMVAPPRGHSLSYPGKPEVMAAHESIYGAGWNPAISVQGYGGKPSLGKPDYPYMSQVKKKVILLENEFLNAWWPSARDFHVS